MLRPTHRPALLRQRGRLLLHFRISETLSGATGRGGEDARAEAGEGAGDSAAGGRHGDQLRREI